MAKPPRPSGKMGVEIIDVPGAVVFRTPGQACDRQIAEDGGLAK
jgi:hypothetical protein